MRYPHDRRQSGELLRQAIPLMAKQQATYDPHHYAIWYEYLAGINPDLITAVDGYLASHKPVTDQVIRHIYGRYISGRDVAAIELAQQQLRTAVKGTLDDVTTASTRAGEHAALLAQAASEFKDTGAIRAAQAIAQHATSLTAALMRVVSALEARKLETNLLIDTLEKSQAEPILDPLTRTLNRLGLHRAIDDLTVDNDKLPHVALLMIDIDRFKAVNDGYGHLVGDSVLIEVARVISDCARPPRIVARLGGEEFVLVVPAADRQSCEDIARRLCSRVAALRIRRVSDEKQVSPVSVSIGIALAHDTDDREELLRRADEAMYRAKRAGGNGFIWSPRDADT